jgi:hypothetical protein
MHLNLEPLSPARIYVRYVCHFVASVVYLRGPDPKISMNFVLTLLILSILTPLRDYFLTGSKQGFINYVGPAENNRLEKFMSPDSALIVFTSLGFASVFLALVVGMSGQDANEIMAGISGMTPAAKRQAKFEQLDYMTRVADDAIEARRLGKRFPSDIDKF